MNTVQLQAMTDEMEKIALSPKGFMKMTKKPGEKLLRLAKGGKMRVGKKHAFRAGRFAARVKSWMKHKGYSEKTMDAAAHKVYGKGAKAKAEKVVNTMGKRVMSDPAKYMEKGETPLSLQAAAKKGMKGGKNTYRASDTRAAIAASKARAAAAKKAKPAKSRVPARTQAPKKSKKRSSGRSSGGASPGIMSTWKGKALAAGGIGAAGLGAYHMAGRD
jgi:hypothetical protein